MTTEVHTRELLYNRPSSPVFSNISIIIITIVVLIIRVSIIVKRKLRSDPLKIKGNL